MGKQKVLIVEDEQNIAELIGYNLEKAGYECRTANTGEEALKILSHSSVDLIILDVMLPKMDGFEVCKTLRQTQTLRHIPIFMLTARGEEIDRIVGLELGADDYMVKPFSPRELVLRVKAILRRGKTEESIKDIYKIGSLVVDILKHRVHADHKEIELTPMEFKLLLILIKRQGRVQSRERLLADVWDIHADIDTRTVDTHVKRLREKLGKLENLVETVRGLGYRFKES